MTNTDWAPSQKQIDALVAKHVGPMIARIEKAIGTRAKGAAARADTIPHAFKIMPPSAKPRREPLRFTLDAASGRFVGAGAALDDSGDDHEPSEYDVPDPVEVQAYAAHGVEALTAARLAAREWRQLRSSKGAIMLSALPLARFVACHPEVLRATGNATFHGR
jgi:hypothetical protein